ncbi:hypothetical protein FB451DRAFT_1167608 [Mycena latifolia]|nr:hypothetical protein FB451DRAFT_1167608 [Mycena latifolia]
MAEVLVGLVGQRVLDEHMNKAKCRKNQAELATQAQNAKGANFMKSFFAKAVKKVTPRVVTPPPIQPVLLRRRSGESPPPSCVRSTFADCRDISTYPLCSREEGSSAVSVGGFEDSMPEPPPPR